ncbi:hypothetical protein, partial [Ferrovum sp.]|uniref:hypothetical protein n=1 Tax=Ferrovum sp. TaxID=2609467 RepID=UPI002635FC8A
IVIDPVAPIGHGRQGNGYQGSNEKCFFEHLSAPGWLRFTNSTVNERDPTVTIMTQILHNRQICIIFTTYGWNLGVKPPCPAGGAWSSVGVGESLQSTDMKEFS